MGALLALLGGTAVAVLTQWWAWPEEPVRAAADGAVVVAGVLSGHLLAADPTQRGNGRLVTAASVAWGAWALGAYGPHEVSELGPLAPVVVVGAGATLLLRYPGERLERRSERVLIRVLIGWQLLMAVAMILLRDAGAIRVVATLDHAGGPVLAAALCVLLVLRLRRARGLGRRELMPVLVAAGAVAVSIAALNLALLTGAAWLWPLLLEVNAFTMLAVPVAFGVAALRRRLDRAVVADVVLALAGRVDAEDVREELRRALGDPSLDVVWAPDEVREVPADRLVLPVDGDDGARVAVVLADPGLRRHARLVRAVILAGRLALERTRLADGVRAQLEEIRASGARIAEAALAERRRLERDLQDGAQQRLLALTTQLDALAGAAPDERTRLLVSAAREDLQGAVAELRDLARGLHPAVLVEGGLAPALRVVAARIPLDVELDVPCGRWASAAETAAYFVACEALTNAVKHASASRARVQVRQAGDRLTVEVADDGTGGAVVGAGSGLRGLRDRVGSLGGTLEVRSPPGAGTRVVAGIPLVDVPSVSTFG